MNEKTGIVFLTTSPDWAFSMAARRMFSDPMLLKIDSGRMQADGFLFFINRENGLIWLTETVPKEYICAEG